MGFSEGKEKILAPAPYNCIADLRDPDCADQWFSYCTIYLYIILIHNDG